MNILENVTGHQNISEHHLLQANKSQTIVFLRAIKQITIACAKFLYQSTILTY
jgi:hypothetical protein